MMSKQSADLTALPTQTTPPLDTLKILILQRRDAVLEAIEDYYKMMEAESSPPVFFIVSRVRTLFFDVEFMLKRYYGEQKKEDFVKLSKAVMGHDVDNSINAFREINRILDEKQLTRFDINEKHDTTRVESENSLKGL